MEKDIKNIGLMSIFFSPDEQKAHATKYVYNLKHTFEFLLLIITLLQYPFWLWKDKNWKGQQMRDKKLDRGEGRGAQ